jgi:hypothetical protein
MGICGIRRDHEPGELDQLVMPTLVAFMLIFMISTALNMLVL